MSLINQVLRDLDQRHAGAAAMPSAVKAPAATPVGGARGQRTAMAVLAVVVLAGGGSTLAWSIAYRIAPAAVPPVVASVTAPAPAAVPASAPQPTPVIVLTAAPAASAPAVTVATVAPPEPAPVAKPAIEPVTAQPSTAAASQAVAAAAPASIDKRPPTRTAHERAEAHYQSGVAAHQQGQVNDASTAYAAALREEPRHAAARQALAGILVGQGRADEATRLLSDGVVLAPQHAGIAMMLARVLAEHGDLQRAADVLHSAAIVSPSPEDRAFHAAVLQRLNRHADAAEHYAAALRVSPNNGVWWMGLGISLAAEGRNDVAREAFNRARSSGALSPELSGYVEQRLRQLL